MADAPKKSKGKAPAKAAPKGYAKAEAKIDAPAKPKPKPKPTLTDLRNRWREAQEKTAYHERRVARADASQASFADRTEQVEKATTQLSKARENEAKARVKFIDAQKKERQR